jgi:hypothetical protein
MWQYLVVQYTRKNQKYIPVSSCTVHDETSETCVNIYVYSTRWIIRNISQYLVLCYTMRHQQYVSISSYTVSDNASEICASIYLYSTRWSIRNMCQYLVVQYMEKHQKCDLIWFDLLCLTPFSSMFQQYHDDRF